MTIPRRPATLWAKIQVTAVLVVLLYLVAAAGVWATRNPLANPMTFWTHFGDALRFRALPAFQESKP